MQSVGEGEGGGCVCKGHICVHVNDSHTTRAREHVYVCVGGWVGGWWLW